MIRQAIPVLHITNADASEAFYCGLLGFQREFHVPASETIRDPCYLGISRDGAVLHLSSHAGDGVVRELYVHDPDRNSVRFGAPLAG
jgi:catechol 2,3-dioxygenase-like lactoylglutathione lyase family enzyme